MEQRGTWVLQPPGTLSYRENQLLQERQGKGPGWKWCVLLDPWLPNQVESSCGCRGWLHIGLCMNMASDGAQLERGCLYTAAWAKRTQELGWIRAKEAADWKTSMDNSDEKDNIQKKNKKKFQWQIKKENDLKATRIF